MQLSSSDATSLLTAVNTPDEEGLETEPFAPKKPLTEESLKSWNEQEGKIRDKHESESNSKDLKMKGESSRKVVGWRDEFNPPNTFETDSAGTIDPIHTNLRGDSTGQSEPSTRDGLSNAIERPRRENPFSDLETTWPESISSSSGSPQMAPAFIEAAGQVQASGNPQQTNRASHPSTPRNGMSAGQTVALVSGLVLLIGGAIGLGRWAWKLFRKRRREDDDDTDVEEEIDGDTEAGGSGPTKKLRKRYHARAWHH